MVGGITVGVCHCGQETVWNDMCEDCLHEWEAGFYEYDQESDKVVPTTPTGQFGIGSTYPHVQLATELDAIREVGEELQYCKYTVKAGKCLLDSVKRIVEILDNEKR